LEEEIGEGTS